MLIEPNPIVARTCTACRRFLPADQFRPACGTSTRISERCRTCLAQPLTSTKENHPCPS